MIPDCSQKLLLIAESEINRARMVQEVAAMAAGLRSLADRATTIGALGTSAVGLVVGLARMSVEPSRGKAQDDSWIRMLLDGVGIVAKRWL